MSDRCVGLCLIHGLFGAPADWDATRAALSCLGMECPVVVPTLGPTDDFADATADIAAQLRQARDHDIDWIWAGYSMGGRIAAVASRQELGAQTPVGHVLVAAHPGEADPVARAARWAVDDARAAALLRRGSEAFIRDWYAEPLFASWVERISLQAALAKRVHVEPEISASHLRGLSLSKQPPPAAPGEGAPLLGAVAGAEDVRYLSLLRAHALRHGAPFRAAPACGHALLFEAPELIAEALFDAVHRVAHR